MGHWSTSRISLPECYFAPRPDYRFRRNLSVVGIIIAVFISGGADEPTPLVGFIAFTCPIFGPLLGWLLVWRPLIRAAKKRRKAEWEEMKGRVTDAVRRHRPALAQNLRNALKRNDFGSVTSYRRHEVWREFFTSVGIDMERYPEARDHGERVLRGIEEAERECGIDLYALLKNGHDF